nr:cell growth-regulating nucleolar protein isoform X2 [Dasypus novemcinctus]
MVFFTCNACGESVKKVQVEKHVAICRNCECLSCIDCGKDFWGNDYRNHVKCISEDQKYGGKGYEGKTHKGDIKQQAWIQKINELMKRPNVSPKVRELLEQISGYDNVPRKRAKFQNWMKNSLKVYNEPILEQVWNIFSEASSNEPVGREQDKQSLSQVAGPRAELATTAPPSKASETPREQAEVKKNKRERKEERQRTSKKEKKELKLANHQGNSRSQKPKKHKKGQEAELEAAGEEVLEADGSAEKKTKKKRSKGASAAEAGVDGDQGSEGDSDEEAESGAARRKRKHSEVEADSKKKKMKLLGHSEGGETEDQEAPVKGFSSILHGDE